MRSELGTGQGGSGFARGAGVDGEGVDATRNQVVQGIIYEAVAGYT